MNPIAQLIRSVCESAVLTQLDLAHKIHLSLPNVVKLEDGRREVTIADVKRIAEAVGMAPVELARQMRLWGPRWTAPPENLAAPRLRRSFGNLLV